MPEFSIVMPVYNVAPCLRACLDSVCAAAEQAGNGERGTGNRCGVEIICVDDGSTDGSGAILDEYRKKVEKNGGCGRWKILHQENRGLSAARNAGLEAAQGEYVLFVDGDDLIHPQALAVLRKEAQEGGVDCVRYGWTREDPAVRGWCEVTSLRPRRFSLERNDQLDAAMRVVFGGSVCTACYRRAAIGDVRFEPLRHNEDHVFNAAVFGRFRSCSLVGMPLYYYRSRPDSLTHAVSEEQFDAILRSMQRLHEITRAWPFFGKVRRRAYGYVRSMCAGYCYACTRDIERRMGKGVREKYLSLLRELYASPSFAPNAWTRALRRLSLHLGPLSWPVGAVIGMHGLHEVKGWVHRSMKAVLK